MAHSYERAFYHFVWVTWNREPLLTGQIEQEAYALIQNRCQILNVTLHALGGISDHVHLFVTLPRTLCVADFMKTIKGSSSSILNQKYGCPAWAFKWQGSYGIMTISGSHVPRLIEYIENQKQHHAEGSLWPACEDTNFAPNSSP